MSPPRQAQCNEFRPATCGDEGLSTQHFPQHDDARTHICLFNAGLEVLYQQPHNGGVTFFGSMMEGSAAAIRLQDTRCGERSGVEGPWAT